MIVGRQLGVEYSDCLREETLTESVGGGTHAQVPSATWSMRGVRGVIAIADAAVILRCDNLLQYRAHNDCGHYLSLIIISNRKLWVGSLRCKNIQFHHRIFICTKAVEFLLVLGVRGIGVLCK